MTRRTLIFLLLFSVTISCAYLHAQETKKKTDSKQPVQNKGKKLYAPPVYLGRSARTGGLISKPQFDTLLRQGLTSRDSLGNKYIITGFDFSFAEKQLYEDSVANLVVLTDLYSEYCPGDTIPAYLNYGTDEEPSIYMRIKAGDTLYFNNVRVRSYPGNTLIAADDSAVHFGKAMKFVITK